MTKVLMILMLICLTVSTVSAGTTKWTTYYTTDDNEYSIDNTSFKTVGGERSVWTSWVFGKPYEYNGISNMKIKMVANCSNRTLKSVEAFAYDSDNRQIAKEKHDNPLELETGTANEATYDTICK